MVDVNPSGAAPAAGFPIVDAHQHFWDPARNYHPWLCDEPMIPFRYGDYSSIRGRFLPPDYLAATGHWQVEKTVYVETEWDPGDPVGETRYIHQVAAEYGYPHAVVAQAWLDRDDAAEVLAQQAAFPLVRSVRHKPQASASPSAARRGAPGSMDDPRWRAGYALLQKHGLMFDLQVPWWHLDAAAELARDFPATPLILNHTGLPSDRSPQGLDGWRKALATMAREPNVMLKISGLGLRGQPWQIEDNAPLIRDAMTLFGVERCMFASNFPVDGVVASFETIFDGFHAAVAHLPDASLRKLFHDNAVRCYRL